ncbi:hypothetical protein BpHYR1_016760 [Brachionus plicatilis]|uniref:Uncharacterized protein n=1 Tax=Brachionus plicatilis TaxID=10195 RepID=A0A3M7PHT9_BRAPC|nr:hypothetical protein BpHYR1_016760 [Brachionus plicatilis]
MQEVFYAKIFLSKPCGQEFMKLDFFSLRQKWNFTCDKCKQFHKDQINLNFNYNIKLTCTFLFLDSVMSPNM